MGMTGAFAALEKGCERSIALHAGMITAKTREDIATLVTEASSVGADVDAAWRLLPKVTLALSMALIDDERVTDGKVQHLRVSAAQRAADREDQARIPECREVGSWSRDKSLCLIAAQVSCRRSQERRRQVVELPMDRITTTIKREFLREIVAGRRAIVKCCGSLGELGGVLLRVHDRCLRLLLHTIHEAHAGPDQRKKFRAIHLSPALFSHREQLERHHQRLGA